MHNTLKQLRNLIVHQASPSSNPTAQPGEVLAALGVPSTSIAILSNGTIQSNCISSVGDDVDTVFQACSISKPTAGIATMRLVQQGKLRLDGKIGEYLPKQTIEVLQGGLLATPLTRALVEQITVKQLLSHTAGLSIGGFPGYILSIDDADIPDAETVLTGGKPVNTGRVRVQGLPGYAFAYSGGGLTVLQLILEHVTGQDFPMLMQGLVLDPLEMTHSFWGRPKPGVKHAEAYWTGYTKCDPPYHMQPEQAAAGLWTTPTDLVKLARGLQLALVGKGIKAGEEPILSKELARQMLQEVTSKGMALSWQAPKDPGNAFSHSGNNNPGWYCKLLGYADITGKGFANPSQENCAICVMTNSAMGWPIVVKITRGIQYLNGWDPLESDGSKENVKTAFMVPDSEVDKSWIQWKGIWGTEGEFEISSGDGGDQAPQLRFKTLPAARLRPAGQPQFAQAKEVRIWLVVEGLFLMLCLTQKDGKKVVEVWNEGLGSVDVLEKAH